jgi:D-alanyl-D-alanine carboxypeptidase (penicillin-binding protein 5/6)
MLDGMRRVVLCCCILPSFLNALSPLKVEVAAKGAVLMNAETGAVLWEKNAHVPLFPASTTKMITALYAVERAGFALEDRVTASYDAAATVSSSARRSVGGAHPPYRLEYGGTHIGIKAGEEFSFRTLLYGLMLASGNDAANVIAQHVSGSIPAFMDELNQFVQQKGCKNTVLYTPHGLPHDGHRSSPYDLALLGREFLKNSLLRDIAKTVEYKRPSTNMRPESSFFQHNALVKPGQFFYPKAVGIKTGYTIAAGFSIIAAAEDTERKLIAVLLGCEKVEQRYKDAIALFEAGFNEKRVSRTLFSKGFDLFTHQVEGGGAPLQAHLLQDMRLEYYPSEEPVFKTSVLWHPLALPIASGQGVGEVRVYSVEGKLLGLAPLHAISGVEPTLLYRVNRSWKGVKKSLEGNTMLIMAIGGIFILASGFYYAQRGARKRRLLKSTELLKKSDKGIDR